MKRRVEGAARRRLVRLAESLGLFGVEEWPLARIVAQLLDHPQAPRAGRAPRRRRRALALAAASLGGNMAGREDDVSNEEDLQIRGFDLPTSGRPIAPPTAPSREATWDLAWRYGRDLARLHFVDPEKLYFFWEVTDQTAARAAGRSGKLAARLVAVSHGDRVVHVAENVFAVMNWYWDCEPQTTYRAELGWLNPDGSFETWLASNVIETPRLSANVTDTVVWRTRGRKGAIGSPTARGAGTGLEDELLPSERPHAAASMAGQRRREAARELTHQHWSSTTAFWSRTPIRDSERKS